MKVLLFSADNYERRELERLTDVEKYELANMGAMLDEDCAVYDDEQSFEDDVNDMRVYVDNSFIYFVNI